MTGTWAANVVTISGTPTVAGAALTYTVTLTGGCGVITTTGTIAVTANNTVARTSAAGTDAQTVCINTPITNITYSTTGATGATVTNLPTGVTGTWAANVVTISGTPTVAGAALTYTVTLTGGCGVITTTGTIAVTANNTLSRTSAAGTLHRQYVLILRSQISPIATTGATGATVTNLPTGVTGTWAANVVTISGTPTVAGAALTYTVTLTGGCGVITTTGTIAVTAIPTATINYAGSPFCTSLVGTRSVTLNGTGAYTGGTFSSTAGLTINAATGDITPSSSTPGTYTVTYTIPPSGGCASVPVTALVTITAAPAATINYVGSPFCSTVITAQSVTLVGTAGGTYSAVPGGLSMNPVTGDITPSASAAGTYTITYSIPAGSGCNLFTTTTNVTITDLPTATVSYIGAPFCQSIPGVQSVTLSGTGAYIGGTYGSTAGLTINPATGDITPGTSTPGTYISNLLNTSIRRLCCSTGYDFSNNNCSTDSINKLCRESILPIAGSSSISYVNRYRCIHWRDI